MNGLLPAWLKWLGVHKSNERGLLYETYHANAYGYVKVKARVAVRYTDEFMCNRRGMPGAQHGKAKSVTPMRHSHLQRKTTLSHVCESAACRRALGRPVSRNADTFAYNNRSEVVFSRRASENAEESYAYDNIGNLLLSASGAETNAYTANNLNQYTTISNLCGSAPLRLFQYDPDGNLVSDGAFHYAYDAENRLRAVTSARQTNGAVRVLSAYDHQHRRVRKTVQRLSLPAAAPPMPPPPGEWTTTETHTYFYDDWNLVEERIARADGTASTNRYVWGKDFSGSLQGAGGVGGLLAAIHDGVPYFPCYDVNGNVTRYLEATGATVAAYAYDAFGATVAATGPLADAFPHRFSTKYFDSETGLYYYGYRFYSPNLMRWINRDPIEEDGGVNLYCFCLNNALSRVDAFGQASIADYVLSNMGYDRNAAKLSVFPVFLRMHDLNVFTARGR